MFDPSHPDFSDTPLGAKRPRFCYSLSDASLPSLVTIVTVFCDGAPLFQETVHSVLGQSFQQWEWVVVNKGSTDRISVQVLDRYRHQDARIRVVDCGANQGFSAAWNKGFADARSSYVVHLDSTCLLEPTAVEKCWWCLESYPEFAFVDARSVVLDADAHLWRDGFHSGSALLEKNTVAGVRIVRKAVHEAVGGFDEDLDAGFAEWDFWMRCAAHGYWGGTIPEFLVWNQGLREESGQGDTSWAERLRAFRGELRQRYPQLWNGNFPRLEVRWEPNYAAMSDTLPCENALPKEKPRLLMIAPKLAIGGVEKFNLDLLQQLNRLGWEVTVATSEREAHSWLPLFARYTPDVFALCHFLQLVDYPRFLSYLVRSRDVDVVLVSNSQLGYQLLPYLRSRHPEVSFVDISHLEDEQWRNGGTPRMAVTYQELLDLNLVISRHLERWMVEHGADGERLRVSYCNVNVDEWQPDPAQRAAVRRKMGVDVETPLVLFAGRLCAQKQPTVLAQTLLILVNRNCRFVAVVAGDGPDLAWLRRFVARYGLADRIRVLGGLPSDCVRRLMCAADVLFLPSKYEGIALVIYEAMACGLCVVTADVGGQGELVTPECGVLITPSEEGADVEEYAAVLEELLGDTERCREMGRAGRARVAKNFRVDQMGERVVSLLREAIRLHDERPRPIPSPGLGRACAVEAIELTRLGDVAGRLLRERERRASSAPPPGVKINSHLLDPYHAQPRTLAYFTIQALLAPHYRNALNWRAMRWLVPLKDRLKRALVGKAQV